MGEYQVIARKWRPQRFSDVVGQEHIIQTLKNAIKQQRTAHAYLFVGPRGIGKTTTARIFAKAMNCESPDDGEPCCNCRSCKAVANDSSIDIIEIDAASQNSVDNIRDLRDEVMHVPVNSKYKIYIIDEVHMLSKQAWNALLKTVEEPPSHAKFIFATTEVHMVLATIISRCQRFDLQRISTTMLAERLQKIVAAEKVNISVGAISAIARAADGGMRDAQSLLDQMIAFFSSDAAAGITEEQALSLFGLTSADELQDLIKSILTNNRGNVVVAIYQLATKGKNLETLFYDVLGWLRGIQLCTLLAEPENILEIDNETVKRYREMSRIASLETVQSILESLSPVGRILHDALNKQVFLETIILKAMREAHSVKIEQLIERLNIIRKSGELEIIDKIPEYNNATSKIAIPLPDGVCHQSKSFAPPVQSPPVETVTVAPTSSVVQDVSIAKVSDVESVNKKKVVNNGVNNFDGVESYTLPDSSSTEISLDTVASGKLPEKSTEINPRNVWHDVIRMAEHDKRFDPIICGYMCEASEIKLENNILTVYFDEEFDPTHVTAVKKYDAFLCQHLQHVLLIPDAFVKFELLSGVHNIGDNKVVQSIINQETLAKVKNNSFVKTVVDLFDGEIVDIHG
jgi:DNA polymerase-3 subunit gamma/tau